MTPAPGQWAPPGPDAAEAPDEPSPPFFDLALTTHVPLSIGGAATLELPGRVLLQVDLGWMPPAYGSAINSLVPSSGASDGGVAALVDAALEDVMVVRAAAGWRPFPSAGFELTGGYTYVSLSGSVSPDDLASVVAGDFASEIAQQLEHDITLESQLHNVHVALGWRWVAWDHLLIRANLGYTQTLGSSSSVSIPDHREGEALANPVVDAELGDVYRQYVKLPVLSLGAGYRF
ncbi:MAG: hypothetical protein JRI68_28120 [Deltaproteobacteria bacterium]|nr:hypothetical protein [Deltaproteobacteria bacterium]